MRSSREVAAWGGGGGDRERGSGMGSCRALESKEEGEREEGARKEQG